MKLPADGHGSRGRPRAPSVIRVGYTAVAVHSQIAEISLS
jgi:hypothetical protein